jgi:predicted nucleotidyltransferase
MVKVKNKLKFSLKEKIIKYLLENKHKKPSIREISKALNTDYKNTFNTLSQLKDLVSKEKIGNTNIISLNLIPNDIIYKTEEKRKEEFIEENKKTSLILEDIISLNYPLFIILIFGSYVKNIKTKRSDIDLCVISDNKEKIKNLISKINLLPLKIEVHDFSISEFESMLKTKENNIAKEIIKKNIILYGKENYYNLISKWMKKE